MKIMKNNERKLTEEECVKSGGHFWKYWDATQGVNDITFELNGFSYLAYYPNGNAPSFRGCPLCGRIEMLKPAQWEEYQKGKSDKDE